MKSDVKEIHCQKKATQNKGKESKAMQMERKRKGKRKKGKFGKANSVLVIATCQTLENTSLYHTPPLLLLLLLCVVVPDPLSSHSHSSGNRGGLPCIPAAAFCSSIPGLCQTARDVLSS